MRRRINVNLTEDELKMFYIKQIVHKESIYLSAILNSKDNRFVIDTKTSELFDKKTGKCYIISEDNTTELDMVCRFALIKNLD
jgi:hypothetical protein